MNRLSRSLRWFPVLALLVPAAVQAQFLRKTPPPQSAEATAAPQLDLDAPGAVRFEAIENWRPMASVLTGPIKVIVGIPAQATVRVAPTDEVIVPVSVDPTGSSATIGAFSASVTWDPARLTLVRIDSGGVSDLTVNTTEGQTGTAVFSIIAPAGATGPATVANLVFRASASYGGTTVRVTPTAISDLAGTSLLRATVVRYAAACVAATGKWGDVNGDDAVNIIDAQQISRQSIGLSVARAPLMLAQGDVNGADGVNIIDALHVARFAIGLNSPAPPDRIGQAAFEAPAVAGVVVSPATREVGVGEGASLIASPANAAGETVDGCLPTTWTSSNPAIATVDEFGIVTAQAAGTVEIIATIGTRVSSAMVTVINRAVKVASLQLVEGADIAVYPNVQTGSPIRVRAVNEAGEPLSGVAVTFTVTDGTALIGPLGVRRSTGASTTPMTLITDANGMVSLRVWGGTLAPETGVVTASSAGVPARPFAVTTIPSRLGESICVGDGWGRRCWGNGTRGQLGSGSFASSTTPVDVVSSAITFGPNSVISTEGFGDHTCVTDAAGAAWCWGSNTAGQLGDGTYENRSVPVRVATSKSFVAVVTGSEHTCGLTSVGDGGEIWCWGYNWSGQLGDGTVSNRRSTPVKVQLAGGAAFTAITAGANSTCGRTGAETWYCWGLNNLGQLGDGTLNSSAIPVAVAGSFEQIDLGEVHACGRTAYNAVDQTGGEVRCWGDPGVGALGDGRLTATVAQLTPVPVRGGSGYVDVQAGYYRTCGVRGDNTVWCWGYNNAGQLGIVSKENRAEPTLIPFTGRRLVVSGTNTWGSGQTTCGQTLTSRQVHCWGANLSGKVGTGGPTSASSLEPTPITRVGAAAGVPAALLLPDPFGGLATVPTSTSPSPGGIAVCVIDGTGAPVSGRDVTFRFVSGGSRFVGGASQVTATSDATGLASVSSIVAGTTLGNVVLEMSVVSRTPEGTEAMETYVLRFVVVNAPAALQVIGGDMAWVGGVNLINKVPITLRVVDGSAAPVPYATVTFTTSGGGSLDVGSPGAPLTLPADANGVVTLDATRWILDGTGTLAQLYATADAVPPEFETGTAYLVRYRSPYDVTAVRPGTSCELQAGTIYCWGSNTFGTLGRGIGETTPVSFSPTPAPVQGPSSFTALAEGVSVHKCALLGTVPYCWGLNDAGQLGNGTTENQFAPTPVSTSVAFSSLATGGHTTCGISTTGELYCWGWSGTAGFGVGPDRIGTRFETPTLVGDVPPGALTKVMVAEDAVCVLTSTGQLYCRGDGARGWNLDGSLDLRTTFTQAAGGPWKDVSATYLNVCAIGQDDRVRCAGGDQEIGALGSGAPIFSVRSTLVGGEVASTTAFASVKVFPFGGCALAVGTGEAHCWGNNLSGQAGLGTFESVFAPAPISGVRFAALRPQGFRNNCGISSVPSTAGTLYCWGENTRGEVGVGSVPPNFQSVPAPVKLWPTTPAVVAVTVQPQGAPTSGSAVVGSAVIPTVKVVDYVGTGVGGVTVKFLVQSGGGTVTPATVVTGSDGVATAGSWTLGTEAGVTNVLTVEAEGLPVVRYSYRTLNGVVPASVAAIGNTIQYAMLFDGTSRGPLQVLVRDGEGRPLAHVPVTYRIPDGASCLTASPTPCRIAFSTSVTVTTDAEGKAAPPLQSNGINANWVTPNAEGTYQVEAVVAGLAPITFTMLKRNVYGGNNTCRLHEDGRAFCWGVATKGELGTGLDIQSTNTPLQVIDIPTFTSLAIGPASQHNCGVTPIGEAWCWGNNETGALGTGTLVSYPYPVKVVGDLTFTKLFKGIGSTCGLTTTGALYCWGWSSRSRFGDGEHGSVRPAPTLVNTNGLVFTEVALALEGTCGRTAAGAVHCWSTNTQLLGDGGSPRISAPTLPLASVAAVQLSAGDRGMCATLTDGGVRCWGENSTGQLGQGTTSSTLRFTYTPIGLESGVREVKHGSWQSVCALKIDGSVFCWGQNDFGQLGGGSDFPPSVEQQLIPQPVVGSGTVFGTRFHPAGTEGAYCIQKSGDESFCWGRAWTSGGTTDDPTPKLVILPAIPPGSALRAGRP